MGEKIFPKFLRFPYKTNGTISNIRDVSIEFLEESNDYNLNTGIVNEPIEDVILPQKNSKMTLLEIVNHRFIDILGGGIC